MADSQPTRDVESSQLNECSRKFAPGLPLRKGVTFKPVVGFPGYAVGSDGSVWSGRRGAWQELNPTLGTTGYPQVLLATEDWRKQKIRKVHRVVLEAFVGPRPPGMLCRHYPDPNKLNNALCNLSWGTPKENSADAIEAGVWAHGEKTGKSKLTEKQVLEIRAYRFTRGLSVRLAAVYGVDKETIMDIRNRRSWRHLP